MPILSPKRKNSVQKEVLIRRELHRRHCLRSFLAWSTEALRPSGLRPARHHRLVIEALEWLAETPDARLMIWMPPGSGKSKYASVLFPAWWMANHRGTNVIGVSYGSDLAKNFSRAVQNTIRDNPAILGYSLLNDGVDRWATSNGSEYLAVGAGGAVTGFRADLVIIDDPVRGRADADSETIRNTIWDAYLANIYTRRRPGARIVVIQTRWHEDDLSGRILENDKDWRIIKLPAFATDVDDPLGRSIGEPLWADDAYGYAADLEFVHDLFAKQGATRDWQSLYQQAPRPTEGALFKIANIQILNVMPNLRGAAIGSGWDFAATKQIGTRDPDYTSRVKLARLASGQYVVLDAWRDRGGPDEVDNWLLNISTQDRMDTPSVKISLPQDPGQAGKSQILAFTRLLSGFTVESSPETGDKATRAAPVISQCNGGNLAIVKGPWNRAFLDELAAFPSGTKDDQVDALSRAFGIVGLGAKWLVFSDEILKALAQR